MNVVHAWTAYGGVRRRIRDGVRVEGESGESGYPDRESGRESVQIYPLPAFSSGRAADSPTPSRSAAAD